MQERYRAYCGWCYLLEIEPADFKTWRVIVSGIPEK